MADWDDLMTDLVTIEPYTGQDEYAKPSYGDPVTVYGRIDGKMRKVMTAKGEERVSSVTVYLRDSPGISVLDRMTLPSGWTPTQPVILAVGRCTDERGTAYETIYA